MTSVIRILNKSAAAIAADSAVTHTFSKGSKTINTANKIFTLSKHHPVGVIIYNSAIFVDVPWEVLIKEYRRKLEATSFDHLVDYQRHFFDYLEANLHFINGDQNNYTLAIQAEDTLKGFINLTIDELNLELKDIEGDDHNDQISDQLKKLISKTLIDLKNSDIRRIENLENYTFESFLTDYRDVIIKHFPSNLLRHLKIEKKNIIELLEIYYLLVTSNQFNNSWSGLVFVGYGEKELFPQCSATKVDGMIGKKVRYLRDEENSVSINQKMNSSILPFAQRDVIDTILSGIDKNLDDYYRNTFSALFKETISQISNMIHPVNQEMALELKKIDIAYLEQKLQEQINNFRTTKFVKPLMSTIGSLSKDDLADMAESLVYLTYLKRRMTSAEESVGGPIDVAVISKGDGFIWIKRKHYFDQNLNPNFVNNYLNF